MRQGVCASDFGQDVLALECRPGEQIIRPDQQPVFRLTRDAVGRTESPRPEDVEPGRALVVLVTQRGHSEIRAQPRALRYVVNLRRGIADAESELADHAPEASHATFVVLGRRHWNRSSSSLIMLPAVTSSTAGHRNLVQRCERRNARTLR